MVDNIQLQPKFGKSFLEDHARHIITDPKIALIELIANCWDAGSNHVKVTWPIVAPDKFEICDDGTGMTYGDFSRRWLEFNYNRKEEQGDYVVFPPGNQNSHRKAFGMNGKGRHSMFCFANSYSIETWKDGKANIFHVVRNTSIGTSPFEVKYLGDLPKEGHGTIISAELVRNDLQVDVVRDLIGSKFITDPTFEICINDELVKLIELEHLLDKKDVVVVGFGLITIYCVDSQKVGKTSKQNGIAWWVNKRLVGEPSWKPFDDDSYLDARTTEAKRLTFLVEADILAEDVKEDWSDFKETPRVKKTVSVAKNAILQWLHSLMIDEHKSQKLAVLFEHKQELKQLDQNSRIEIGQFIDGLQTRIPTINQKTLSTTVEVLSNLEKSKSKFVLLDQLAKLKPDDLDALNEILDSWSVQEAKIVLGELQHRLKLVETLSKLVDNPATDELHQIHPLISQSMWIFGPEYESIQFISNRSLLTVIEIFFKDKLIEPLNQPRNRPDFVVLPDTAISLYASDSFNNDSEVDGVSKVLIVELKKGGSEIGIIERRQAEDYARELRKSGKIQHKTEIKGFVLGSTVAKDCLKLDEGNTTIYPNSYSLILRVANARLFNLREKISQAKSIDFKDSEVENVVNSPDQVQLL